MKESHYNMYMKKTPKMETPKLRTILHKKHVNLYEWGRTNSYELATLLNMYKLLWDRADRAPFLYLPGAPIH